MGFRYVFLSAAFLLILFYGSLLASIFYFSSGRVFLSTLSNPLTLHSIRLSLFAATITTLLALSVGLPAAYALSRFSFPCKRILDTMLEIPMIISPVALGASILLFFNSPVGEAIQNRGFFFVFEIPGIVLAQFATTAGLCTRLLKVSFDEIPSRFEAVARSLGCTAWRAFFAVTLPLAFKGLLASVILTWAKALGEFGATIMVAGAMPGRTETMPIAIFLSLASGDIEKTIVLILILAFFGLSTLYVVRLTGKRYHRYD